jgi:2-C-methyl-D-erythritol 4-phosphate cytidylyltransferase
MKNAMQHPPVTVLLMAAGSGKRLNAGVNKIWLELAGMTILERSIRIFLESACVTAMVIVVSEAEVAAVQELIVQINLAQQFSVDVVSGGAERQDSVYNGLKFLEQKLPGEAGTGHFVAIHDAARPLLTREAFSATALAAQEHGAAGTGVPVKDTIKQVDPEGFITGTPERSTLWAVQTPQVFDYKLLWGCYQMIADQGLHFSDDCGVVEYCGHRVKMVLGTYENIKITTPEDLVFAEIVLQCRKEE